MAPRFDTDILRRLSSKLLVTAQKYATHSPPTTTRPISVDLVFPPPESLTPQLLKLGVSRAPAERISLALSTAVLRLRGLCEADFQRRRLSLQLEGHHFQDPKSASRLSSTYLAIYTKTIKDWTSYIVNDVTPRVLAAQTRRRSDSSERRRPFNTAAIPSLESHFEENAFPSRLEKLELASEFDMEYKQIHVWFQNRRSRFRKEGKELKQRPRSVPVLEELADTVVDALLPTESEGSDDEASSNPQTSSPQHRPVICQALLPSNGSPPHAYPTPYPPVCPYDPFPDTTGKRGFKLPWLRLPDSSRASAESPDVDSLISAFTELSFSESTADPVPTTPLSPAPLGFATYCPPAPHPAFIRHRPRPLPKRRSVSSTSTCPKHGDPNTPSRIPPSITAATCRLKRALPRRLPKHPPIGYALSEASSHSPIRSLSLASRKVSSDSLSSLSGASGSEVESPLSTPLLSSTDLSVVDPWKRPGLDESLASTDLCSLADVPWHSHFSIAALPDWGTLPHTDPTAVCAF